MVYFILNPDTNRLKIGYTTMPVAQRMATLEVGAGCRLHLAAQAPGKPDAEATIQAAFSHLRYFGEWYVFEGQLPPFVRAIREAAPELQHRWLDPEDLPRFSLLRLAEAAQVAHTDADTVFGWISAGYLPAYDMSVKFRRGQPLRAGSTVIDTDKLRVVAALQSVGLSQAWTQAKTGWGAPSKELREK